MRKREPWDTNISKSNNHRMLQPLASHTQQTIKATSTQDLDPRPRTLNWKPLGFLSHIKRCTHDDRFPLALWEVWFCSSLGVPIPALIGPSQQCVCNAFHLDSYGDHLQTCQSKSAATQVHDWFVYKLSGFLGSVGHRVKIHKITPARVKDGVIWR
jgi:hypothetical protein